MDLNTRGRGAASLRAKRGDLQRKTGFAGAGRPGRLGVAALEVVDPGADGLRHHANHEGEDEHAGDGGQEPEQATHALRVGVRPCRRGLSGARHVACERIAPGSATYVQLRHMASERCSP